MLTSRQHPLWVVLQYSEETDCDHVLQHVSVVGRIPLTQLPQLILSAEAELDITAGLQDRVIQVRPVRACGPLLLLTFDPFCCNVVSNAQ